MAEPLPKAGLRLFLSADLAGSTAFKQAGKPDEWQKFFRNFYRQLPAYVLREAEALHEPPDILKVWKLIGDEVVFSTDLTSWDQAARCVRVFREALFQFRRATVEENQARLDVKAAGWTAGFPVGNIRVEPLDGLGEDYIGPGMDIGFRLVKASTPRRMHLSVELAWLLSIPEVHNAPGFHVGAGLDLKGVARGRTYPCFWLDNFIENPATLDADNLQLEEERLRQEQPPGCPAQDVHAFCARWLDHMGPPFLVPFIDGDPVIGSRPPDYEALYQKVTEEGTQGPQDDVEPEPTEAGPTSEEEILRGLKSSIVPPAGPPEPDSEA